MCGPFLEAVKGIQGIPKCTCGVGSLNKLYKGNVTSGVHKSDCPVETWRLGKALNDSVRAYRATGYGTCCGAKPVGRTVTLYPNPKDVQREYDSLRVIDPRIEPVYLSPYYVYLERILNNVVRDKLIELGYKGNEAKVKMMPLIRTRYKHKFGTPKERKAVERRVNSEIREYTHEWKGLRDYEDTTILDTTIMPPNVTKGDSRPSGEITPAPNQGIRETSPDFREHKYARLVEHGTRKPRVRRAEK